MAAERCVNLAMTDVLPWYVNGTLGDEERRVFESHLVACAACRGEVAVLRQFAVVLHEETPAPSGDLYDRTVARLKPRGWLRLSHVVRQIVIPVPTYARVALVAQLAIIVALAAVLAPRGVFSTLSEGPRHPGPGVQVQVVFSPGATAQQIQAVLAALNGRIIDGPTPLGIYSVEIPLGTGATVSTADEVLRTLRASPAVKFAEVLQERR